MLQNCGCKAIVFSFHWIPYPYNFTLKWIKRNFVCNGCVGQPFGKKNWQATYMVAKILKGIFRIRSGCCVPSMEVGPINSRGGGLGLCSAEPGGVWNSKFGLRNNEEKKCLHLIGMKRN